MIRVPARLFVSAACVFVVACLSPSALGQHKSTLGKGSISGTVTDQNGAAVAGADVVLSNDAGVKLETKSDDKGVYSFTELHSGTYTLVVSASSFPPLKMDYITLAAGQKLPLDASLQGELPKAVATPAAAPVETPPPSPVEQAAPAAAAQAAPAAAEQPATPTVSAAAGKASISGIATDQTLSLIHI